MAGLGRGFYQRIIVLQSALIGNKITSKVGFYGKAPIVRPTGTPANATDLATAQTLVNDLKAKLIALGLIQ